MNTLSPDDVAQVLTALHDLRAGYQERDLADGWAEAANRVADALGRCDPRDWPEINLAERTTV